MSARIDPPPPDDPRVELMLRDPAGYFENARKEIRAQVIAEMAAEERARRKGLPWWRRWL